ncbi:MAG: hypothetical protein ACE5J9_11075 [Methanosarcinales archaeon]
MNRNKLMEITPKEWGLLVHLSQSGLVDLDGVKTAMKEIANTRILQKTCLELIQPVDSLSIEHTTACIILRVPQYMCRCNWMLKSTSH